MKQDSQRIWAGAEQPDLVNSKFPMRDFQTSQPAFRTEQEFDETVGAGKSSLGDENVN